MDCVRALLDSSDLSLLCSDGDQAKARVPGNGVYSVHGKMTAGPLVFGATIAGRKALAVQFVLAVSKLLATSCWIQRWNLLQGFFDLGGVVN